MGSLSDEPLASLVREVARDHGIRTCVETGTAHGSSAFFAATLFDRVVTIDRNQEFQDEARRREAMWRERGERMCPIEYVLGDSRQVFEPVVAALEGPACFWLDAHSFPGVYGPDFCCPLLDEVDIINRYDRFGHWILIDDMHDLPSKDPATYPTIDQLLDHCRISRVDRRSRIWQIAHDTLVLAPCHGIPATLERFRVG